jgi:hypothetical protein
MSNFKRVLPIVILITLLLPVFTSAQLPTPTGPYQSYPITLGDEPTFVEQFLSDYLKIDSKYIATESSIVFAGIIILALIVLIILLLKYLRKHDKKLW